MFPCFSLKKSRPIKGLKIFTAANIEELTFDSVNGVNANNIVFKSNDSVIIKGEVAFKKALTVNSNVTINSGLVNDVEIEKEVLVTGRNYSGMN